MFIQKSGGRTSTLHHPDYSAKYQLFPFAEPKCCHYSSNGRKTRAMPEKPAYETVEQAIMTCKDGPSRADAFGLAIKHFNYSVMKAVLLVSELKKSELDVLRYLHDYVVANGNKKWTKKPRPKSVPGRCAEVLVLRSTMELFRGERQYTTEELAEINKFAKAGLGQLDGRTMKGLLSIFNFPLAHALIDLAAAATNRFYNSDGISRFIKIFFLADALGRKEAANMLEVLKLLPTRLSTSITRLKKRKDHDAATVKELEGALTTVNAFLECMAARESASPKA